jgi:hypothetical protein
VRNRKRQHPGSTTEPDRWRSDDLPSVRPYLDGSPIFVGEIEIDAAVVFSDADVYRALRGVKRARASSRSTADLIASALAALPFSS